MSSQFTSVNKIVSDCSINDVCACKNCLVVDGCAATIICLHCDKRYAAKYACERLAGNPPRQHIKKRYVIRPGTSAGVVALAYEAMLLS